MRAPVIFQHSQCMDTIDEGQIRSVGANQQRLSAAGIGWSEATKLAIIDSQSVKLGQKGGGEHGFDGNKRVCIRKRHIVVDVLGLVLGCYVCG